MLESISHDCHSPFASDSIRSLSLRALLQRSRFEPTKQESLRREIRPLRTSHPAAVRSHGLVRPLGMTSTLLVRIGQSLTRLVARAQALDAASGRPSPDLREKLAIYEFASEVLSRGRDVPRGAAWASLANACGEDDPYVLDVAGCGEAEHRPTVDLTGVALFVSYVPIAGAWCRTLECYVIAGAAANQHRASSTIDWADLPDAIRAHNLLHGGGVRTQLLPASDDAKGDR